MADAIQLEASVDRILLEDGTGVVLLEVTEVAFEHLPLFGIRRPRTSLIPFDSVD